MRATETYVAVGIVLRGSFDSSENTTDDSNPTKPSTASTRMAPTPGPNRLPGERVSNEMDPPAG